MQDTAGRPDGHAEFAFRLVEKTEVAPGIVRLVLAADDGPHLAYREGQFLSLCLPGGQTRCYSMASADMQTGQVELHVRVYAGGLFSQQILAGLTPAMRLRANGPFGTCIWRPGPALMLGTGTGIAPLKAMTDRLALAGYQGDIHLYWGMRTQAELYLADYFAQQKARLPGLRFVPVLSADPSAPYRQGRVQDAALADFPAPDGMQVYACGAPAMVDEARTHLLARGLAPACFHADPFEPPQATPPLPTQPLGSGAEERISIKIHTPGHESLCVRVPVGGRALQTLRQAGIPILSVCGGKQACGTCRLRLELAPSRAFPTPDRDEARLLAALDDPSPRDRLACQMILTPQCDGATLTLAP